MAHNSSASPPPSTTAATEPICAACSSLPEAHERRHAHLPTLDYSRLPVAAVFDALACLVIVAAATWLTIKAAVVLTVLLSGWLLFSCGFTVATVATPRSCSCPSRLFFQGGKAERLRPGGEPDPVRFNLMATSSDIRR